MTVSKAQALRYIDGFRAEVSLEQAKLAEEDESNGFRLLAGFLRHGRGSVYEVLQQNLDHARFLVETYGPEQVERTLPWDDEEKGDEEDMLPKAPQVSQARTIAFEGSSDDLIEVCGPCFYDGKVNETGEEWSAYSSQDECVLTSVLTDGTSALMHVYALYTDAGCWTFAPGMTGEDTPLPEWPMRFLPSSRGTGYSLRFEVDVPDGVFAMTLDDWKERQAQRETEGT